MAVSVLPSLGTALVIIRVLSPRSACAWWSVAARRRYCSIATAVGCPVTIRPSISGSIGLNCRRFLPLGQSGLPGRGLLAVWATQGRRLDRVALKDLLGGPALRPFEIGLRNGHRLAGHASQCFVNSTHGSLVPGSGSNCYGAHQRRPSPSGRGRARRRRRALPPALDRSSPVEGGTSADSASRRRPMLGPASRFKTVCSKIAWLAGLKSKSRHTSSTMSRPTGCLPSAIPLTSALSQITLIVRGMPRECSWMSITASRVNRREASPPAVLMRLAI